MRRGKTRGRRVGRGRARPPYSGDEQARALMYALGYTRGKAPTVHDRCWQ